MVLDEGIHGRALGGEVGNHVGLGNDDLAIQDVVIGVVAVVDHEGEVDHKASGVALAVGAGVGGVGGEAVVSKKLILALAVDDDASACALHFGSDVNPTTYIVDLLILKGVGVN